MSFARSLATRTAAAAAHCSRSATAAGPAALARHTASATTSRALSSSAAGPSRLFAQPTRVPRQQRPHLSATAGATRALSTETRAKLDAVTKSDKLVVFMKGTPDMPMCGFSRAVVQILDVQGVDLHKLKSVNVLEDEEVRHGVKEYSDWPTIPQVYVNGEFVGGCDIMMSMHQSGELEDLLVKHKIIPDGPAFAQANPPSET